MRCSAEAGLHLIRYADDDAFAAHRGSDAMAAATPALAELIAEPELTVGGPVIAKGLPA